MLSVKNVLTPILISIPLFFYSCAEEDEPSGTGKLSVQLGLTIEESPAGKLGAVSTDDFMVIIYDGSGSEYLRYNRAADMPAEIELPSGTYSVAAHSNNDLAAAFENPYYYGTTSSFVLDKEEFKQVTVSCSLANMIVTVEYSENVTGSFDEYSTVVSNSSGASLLFGETEIREGYFAVDPLTLEATLVYHKGDGSSITKVFNGSINNPQPKTHYKIVVDAVISDGKISINIVVDGTTDIVVVDLGDAGTGSGTDDDYDGYGNSIDNCPFMHNPNQVDGDGDGVGDSCDCNNTDAAISTECYTDADADGIAFEAGDCDDADPAVYPGAVEICGDGRDNDCNGLTDDTCITDADGDGYGVENGDCDDDNTAIHPAAVEVCGDGIDNNCNGQVDESCTDDDGDGVASEIGDCSDNDASVYPGAAEICGDNKDNDCNGQVDETCGVPNDADGDGLDDDWEIQQGLDVTIYDSDGDGISDGYETNYGQSIDTDSDGDIDALDTDSDNDNISDSAEGAGDNDLDGIPNFRDIN